MKGREHQTVRALDATCVCGQLQSVSSQKIKDTSVSELGGILGSDPVPHILSTEIFSVWTTELKLWPMQCLAKKETALASTFTQRTL